MQRYFPSTLFVNKPGIARAVPQTHIKILNDMGNGELEVEVQTLSKKNNEKRGQAKLHMYRPHESRKK